MFKRTTKPYCFTQALLIVASLFISSINCFAQQKFNPSDLNFPYQKGVEIDKQFENVEVNEYAKPANGSIALSNGLRRSSFVNESEWTQIKDSVRVTKIEVVYSKYPTRNTQYREIYPLLFQRIKSTIALDSNLNNDSITWVKVLQSNCQNDRQVSTLFHGVVIWYEEIEKAESKKNRVSDEDIQRYQDSIKQIRYFEQKPKEISRTNITEDEQLPDSLRTLLYSMNRDQQTLYLREYFRKVLSSDDLTNRDEFQRLNEMNEINLFLRNFPESEPIIHKVFNRHPEWKEKIVINDWTGSMYAYSAQVLEWHLMNKDSSNIATITLFNDGNNKRSKNKKIGRTGGIYTEKADNPEGIIQLFTEVMQRGAGGDAQENDIEAILKAIEGSSDSAEIVLIADNRSCVRDIELANKIGRPVRVILCGYNPNEGVNAHYAYLAKVTNGGIYTIEEDFSNLKLELGKKGRIVSFDDQRIKLKSATCFDGSDVTDGQKVYSLREARLHKRKVHVLDARSQLSEKYPPFMFKCHNLNVLDLGYNRISSLPLNIGEFEFLNRLNLQHNALSDLPESISKLSYLEYIDLSNNHFSKIPENLLNSALLKYIDLSNNNISSLPTDLSSLEHLQGIDLTNNPLSEYEKNRITTELPFVEILF